MLDTENDTHTGVDACMYDKENNVIIFYGFVARNPFFYYIGKVCENKY